METGNPGDGTARQLHPRSIAVIGVSERMNPGRVILHSVLAAVGCVPFTPSLQTLPDKVSVPGSLPDRLAALARRPTPWVAVVDGGRRYDPMADRLEEAGVAVLRSMDRAVRLLGRYVACRSGTHR